VAAGMARDPYSHQAQWRIWRARCFVKTGMDSIIFI